MRRFVAARGRFHQLLLDWFVDCSPHRIALPCLLILCRTCLRGQELPLIGLVTGPHNFEGGESVAFCCCSRPPSSIVA